MSKKFLYFMSTEGGMEEFEVASEEDLKGIIGWMDKDCKKADTKLLMFMENAKVGEVHDHRMGALVRLRDSIPKSAGHPDKPEIRFIQVVINGPQGAGVTLLSEALEHAITNRISKEFNRFLHGNATHIQIVAGLDGKQMPLPAPDTGDFNFLEWIADRLVHVYGENPNTDFVLKLRQTAKLYGP